MAKFLQIILLTLFLSGCSWFTKTEYITKYVDVMVPVPVECARAPARIPLDLVKLQIKDKKNYDKIIKTTLINQTICEGKVEELETILNGYR